VPKGPLGLVQGKNQKKIKIKRKITALCATGPFGTCPREKSKNLPKTQN
jgi:hypothetical protein